MTDQIFILPIAIFRAMFDSDGSIFAAYDKKDRKNGTFYVNITWKYSFSQSERNRLNVDALSQMLERSGRDKQRLSGREAGKIEVCCEGTMLSPAGQQILSAYKNSPPKALSRLKQFLACEYCTTTIASTEDQRNIICELLIAEAISTEEKERVDPIIQKLQEKSGFSDTVVAEGRELAAKDLEMLDKKCADIWEKVAETRFTEEEVIGATVADGSFGIGYKLEKKGEDGQKLSFQPIFTVTNMNSEPCEALQKTFGNAGSVQRSGKNAFQYRLSGKASFKKYLVPIFEKADLYSKYKQSQWDKTWDIVQRLDMDEHKTFIGFCKIIDDSYAISAINKRKHPIEFYKNSQLMPGEKRR